MAFNDTLKNLLSVIKTAQTTALATKAPIDNPAFTGIPTAPTAVVGTDSTQIATTAFVKAAVDVVSGNLATALTFKGVLNSPTGLPSKNTVGATYVVGTSGTYAGEACEVGDFIFCVDDKPTYKVVQKNIDGAVTGPTSSVANHVAVFDGSTGKVVKDSGYTISKSVPSNAEFTDTKYTAGSNVSISNSNVISATVGVTSVTPGTSANKIIVNTNGTSSTLTVNNVENASKATNDSKGQSITGYVKSLSISGKTITVTDGNGTTKTLTTQDTVATVMGAATSTSSGAAGLVPAPSAGEQYKVLTGSASYASVEDLVTTYSIETIQGWWDTL